MTQVAGHRRRAIAATCGTALVGVAVALTSIGVSRAAPAAPASSALQGVATADGRPLGGARVTVLGGSRTGVRELERATTDASGTFTLTYTEPPEGIVYLEASRPGTTLRLRSVVGFGSGGAVAPRSVSSVAVNELTTVATAYALAQFSSADGVSGPRPGLENAAATTFNLVDPADGTAGAVVTNEDNGANNDTLATLGTLANLVSLCARPASRNCDRLLRLATPPGGEAPADTAQAMVNLARNPTLAPGALYALARGADLYQPALTAPPSAWILVLRFTANGLYASGRVAIDATGNIWSSTNWVAGTQDPSPYVTALDPLGQPTLGSPISGGGMKGGAWGIAITPQGVVWVPSFGGDSIAKYSAAGVPLSPSTGYTNGGPDHPQGTAIDQNGNLWIANNYGPESAPGEGNIVVYPGGDPAKAVTITGGGLNHPFAVQIDTYGRAWVTNAGLGGAKLVGTRGAFLIGKFGGSVTVIGQDFKPTPFSPIEDPSFKLPLAIAFDSQSNAWIVNYIGSTVTELRPDGNVAEVYELPRGTNPWSQAVDGSDRVWVAGFTRPRVWLLCGEKTSACPPGSTTGTVLSPKLGFESEAFQHLTSIQLDQSGNVWLSNNWSNIDPPVGGNGVNEIIGVATPVCTPLQPLPQQPSSASGASCPQQAATALPGGSSDTSTWLWVAIAAAALAVLAAGAAFIVRRRHARA